MYSSRLVKKKYKEYRCHLNVTSRTYVPYMYCLKLTIYVAGHMYILTFAQYNMYQLIHIIVVKRYNKWPKVKWPYTLAYDGIKSKWGMLKKSTQLSFAKRSEIWIIHTLTILKCKNKLKLNEVSHNINRRIIKRKTV